MSTDQYPEVSGDDSGLVPPHAPRAEWPKKIRTLTAAELDRLTIDGAGRFYWDGHLVNYQPPQPPQPQQASAAEAQPVQPGDLDALALLDRAALELSGQPATAHAPSPAEPAQHAVVEPTAVEVRPIEVPATAAPTVTAVATVSDVTQISPMPILDMSRRGAHEKVRVRMSFWQSLGLLIAILGLLIAAAGIAISGLVAAHEWGCRIELVKQYCPPPPPAPKPPPRADIPA